MDIVKIVGISPVSFKGQGGEQVEGMSFFFEQDFPDGARGSEGVRTGRFFLSSRALGGCDFVPSIGAVVDLLYNRFGKVCDFKLVDA